MSDAFVAYIRHEEKVLLMQEPMRSLISPVRGMEFTE